MGPPLKAAENSSMSLQNRATTAFNGAAAKSSGKYVRSMLRPTAPSSFNGAAAKSSGKYFSELTEFAAEFPSMGPPLKAAENKDPNAWWVLNLTHQWGRR